MKDHMSYKGYYGSVHFNEEDLVFHGKIEFIRALVTYEATDAKGLKKAFHDSVNDYLATCDDQNIEPEKPFKGSLNVRLGHRLHQQVAIEAQKSEMTINKYIVEMLSKSVRHNGDSLR